MGPTPSIPAPRILLEAIIKQETRGFGFLDRSRLPEDTRQHVFEERIQFAATQIQTLHDTIVPSGPLQELFVELNADPRVNAMAIPRRSFSIVSLNAGMCVRLGQLFQFAVYDHEVFPSGPREQDTTYPKDILLCGLQPKCLLETVDLSLPSDTPSDDSLSHIFGPLPPTHDRFNLALRLTMAAIDFVAMHEFAHIVRNHIAVLPFSASRRSFPEVSCRRNDSQNSNIESANNRLRQLLEIDADRMAADFSLSKFTDPDTLTLAWAGWATSSKEGLALWLKAIQLAWLLFDGWSLRIVGEEDEHPHPAVRLLTMMTALAGSLDETPGVISAEDFVEAVVQTTQSCRSLWARLGLSTDRFAPFTEMRAVRDASRVLIERYNSEVAEQIGQVHLFRKRF